MDIRCISKSYIDMDELSKQWESANKLILNGKGLPEVKANPNIIDYIKNVKYDVLEMDEKPIQRVMIKR